MNAYCISVCKIFFLPAETPLFFKGFMLDVPIFSLAAPRVFPTRSQLCQAY